MATTTTNGLAQVVVLNNGAGVTVVPTGTPLTRLNYFDGKFLRATDFALEQTYQRKLVAFSNQGLGSGVVYGFDVTLGDGDTLQIGPGLGIDPGGGVLLLPGGFSVGVQDLIDASRPQASPVAATGALARKRIEPNAVFTDSASSAVFSDCLEVTPPPPSTVVPAGNLYVVVLCSAEALCGQQDVMGNVCDAACVTSTDRPYRLDSVVVRAIPLQLVTPFPTSKVVSIDADLYLRSKVAHAYFGDEVARHPAQISRQGLLSDLWCLGAGYDGSCCEVPIAVIARSGSATTFLDPWIARRERMSAPAHRYWQWRMRMRPWEVFMAQVLQFQCQLAEVLTGAAASDPTVVRNQTSALGNAAQFLDGLRTSLTNAPGGAALLGLSFTHLSDLQQELQLALKKMVGSTAVAQRVLIQGGILELPAAGYLPVTPGSAVSVNDQVRALLGEGLDLRFCVVTADYAAHALETAQHMDRISLLQGLDDPSNKPKVDILVPGGALAPATTTNAGGYFDAALTIGLGKAGASYKGAAREEVLPSGGSAMYSAGAGLSLSLVHEATSLSTSFSKGEKVSAAAMAPTLTTNPTAKLDPLGVSTFLSRLAAARAASAGTTPGGKPAPSKVGAKKAAKVKAVEQTYAAAGRTIDGYWLTARTEQRLRDLPLFSQSSVSGRVIIGNASENVNADSEVAFQGALTVTDVIVVPGVGPIVKGYADLTLAIENTKASLPASATPDAEEDQTILERAHLDVILTYDDLAGTITVDLYDTGPQLSNAAAPLPFIRAVRASSDAQIVYTLSKHDDTAQTPTLQPVAKLTLTSDADVSRAANPLHQLANSGLDLVQAGTIESEPSFESVANAQLFPALAPSTTEAPIQAVDDWVLFMKRRERTCADEAAPAPALPPRSYRVFNWTTASIDEAQKVIQQLRSDPTFLADEVKRRNGAGPDLVLGFQGGTSQPLFDPAAAEADWRQFNPGDRIAGVIFGARGDDDAATQIARLKRFEQAIAADSLEDPSVPSSQIDFPIVPFPDAAIPPDADGVMFLVTIQSVETNHAYGVRDQKTWTALLQALKNNNLDPAFLNNLEDLGLATFQQGTGTLVGNGDDDIGNNYQAKFGGGTKLAAVAAVYPSSDSSSEQQGRVTQSQQIATDLGGQAQVQGLTYGGTFPISDASAMTFVLALAITRVARVLVEVTDSPAGFQVVNSDPTLVITMGPQGPVGGQLPPEIVALGPPPEGAFSLIGVVAAGAGTAAVTTDVAALLPLMIAADVLPTGAKTEATRTPTQQEQPFLTAGVDELIVIAIIEVG